MHWAHRIDQALEQDHRVESSKEVGMHVMITRTIPIVATTPPPVAAPVTIAVNSTQQPTVASKVVIATPTQPSTSQEKTKSVKRTVKTVKKS